MRQTLVVTGVTGDLCNKPYKRFGCAQKSIFYSPYCNILLSLLSITGES